MSASLPLHAGLAFGRYPEREDPSGRLGRDALRAVASLLRRRTEARLDEATAAAAAAVQRAEVAAGPEAYAGAVARLREELLRDGLDSPAAARALGLAAAAMQRSVGLAPYPTQLLAAWAMLGGSLAEMATGEGKTLALALAAGVAGLAGVPVHVLTANDYLVRRDADTMAPFYALLGLQSAAVLQATPAEQRAAAYRCQVVYTTAKELGFDYLKDHHRLGGVRDPRLLRARAAGGDAAAGPVLPGLCLALVDEADSLLLDEACVPLILAERGPAPDVPALRRAWQLAQQLEVGQHYGLQPALRRATLRDVGCDLVTAAVQGAQGMLRPPRRAIELVESALIARHLLGRERDYAVTAQGVQLIDELTGRIAEGRRWSGVLHAMVEIKEGLEPAAPHVTAAQITYQRLFPRYLRLAGMSGTLHEARHELAVLYGLRTVRVPLARPSQRRWLGQRLLRCEADKWDAVVETVRRCRAAGRPVLVGTESVAASHGLSQRLAQAGIAHEVLNATQDAREAEQVARAGCSGAVTVATNIAGRGTDIRLDVQARAAGGLHVIAALRNPARRIDRQLIGRSARHGDPGSAEVLAALDDALLRRCWPAWVLRLAAALPPQRPCLPAPVAAVLLGGAQRLAQLRDFFTRRQLRQADQAAEDTYGFTGNRE